MSIKPAVGALQIVHMNGNDRDRAHSNEFMKLAFQAFAKQPASFWNFFSSDHETASIY